MKTSTDPLGRLAHDLNNRLAALMGQIEVVRLNAAADSEIQEDLKEALTAAEAMSDTISSMRRFALPGLRQAKTLRETLFGMGELLRNLQGSSDLELHESNSREVPRVLAATGQMEHLILALVTALRFLCGHDRSLALYTGCLDFSEENEASPGLKVAIRIQEERDSGGSIAPGPYSERFNDADEAARLAPGCRAAFQIVEELGGSLHREVSTRRDTSITAYLPAYRNRASSRSQRIVNPEVEEQRSGTIVLIEDDNLIRGYTKRALESAGYEVQAAASAEEALSLVDSIKSRVNLLIVDLVLPGTHGGRLARQLAERLNHPPVLFVSGYDNNAIYHHRLLDSDAELLQKPYDPVTLVDRASRLISESCA